jgi:hypothetical protein
MSKCLCYNCKNRQIGCHKFCDNYRAYRRELEAMQAAQKKESESNSAYLYSLVKNNYGRKAKRK